MEFVLADSDQSKYAERGKHDEIHLWWSSFIRFKLSLYLVSGGIQKEPSD